MQLKSTAILLLKIKAVWKTNLDTLLATTSSKLAAGKLPVSCLYCPFKSPKNY